MKVCVTYSGGYIPSSCVYIRRYLGSDYSLSPGGHVTVHFSQLVVADSVYISKYGLLTLCEVDVLGTKVVLSPEGLFSSFGANVDKCQQQGVRCCAVTYVWTIAISFTVYSALGENC